MIRILANDGIHSDGKSLLEEAGYEVITDKVAQEDLPGVLPAYDVVIVRSATKIRKDLIDQCPKLKVIARAGVGLDNIDFEYARAKGITVMNTPAASSQSVAELVFAHMLSLARNLHHSNRVMPSTGHTDFKKLKKAYASSIQLRNRTLGIIGFGRIGQEVARLGLGLGMRILATDLMVDEGKIEFEVFNSEYVKLVVNIPTVEKEEVLRSSDFITLHVPFDGGKPILGAREFEQMKHGVMVFNTSRGGAIDEAELLKAMESGKVAGAGLDVFEGEPTPKKEILEHPRISISPHVGATTLEAQANIGLELADKILAFFGDDK